MIAFWKAILARTLFGLGMLCIALATMIDKQYVETFLIRQRAKETT